MIYLFDFDGTLVDSMPTYASQMLRILDETGTPYSEDVIKTVTPLGYIGAARYYIDKLGINLTFEEVVDRMGRYMYEEYVNNILAKDTVPKTLLALRGRGDRLNVLTASPHLTLDPCLKRLGLFDLFDNVWSCNDFDLTKADTAIYREAAKKLGVDVSEITFLDDNLNACRTAKLAGMRVIGVYDATSAEYTAQMKSELDGYVVKLDELL
ncbi:MAG: HAD family hydrolase [Eubacteriales bacterium]